MRYTLLSICLLICLKGQAQTYADSIAKYWQSYKEDFIKEERSPIKGKDTIYLRFYPLDVSYRVIADFTPTPDTKPFDIPTHSGKMKSYRQYGLLRFKVHGQPLTLQIYQSQTLMKIEKYKDDLFIPFTDTTNYTFTYGGGRYLDIKINDINNNKLVLDFNKAYNPYCAFAEGYSCPIPPTENRLNIAIQAGEKLWAKPEKE